MDARAEGQSGEVSLVAEFNALPGAREAVATLVERLVVEVRAEAGNVRFDAWVRDDDAGHWVVFETYASGAAFEAHISSEHSRVFNAALGPLVVDGSSRLVWLQPTPSA